MISTFKLGLHANQRIFVNGAVLRVDRKVGIEFLNDVTFLLDNYVLQPEHVTSPLRQLYFAVQALLIDPVTSDTSMTVYGGMLNSMLAAFSDQRILHGLKQADSEVRAGRAFDALKTLKGLFEIEAAILAAVHPHQATAGKALVSPSAASPAAALEGSRS
jgi:flagellar biosynthesis repressor protein FlbT